MEAQEAIHQFPFEIKRNNKQQEFTILGVQKEDKWEFVAKNSHLHQAVR